MSFRTGVTRGDRSARFDRHAQARPTPFAHMRDFTRRTRRWRRVAKHFARVTVQIAKCTRSSQALHHRRFDSCGAAGGLQARQVARRNLRRRARRGTVTTVVDDLTVFIRRAFPRRWTRIVCAGVVTTGVVTASVATARVVTARVVATRVVATRVIFARVVTACIITADVNR